MAAIRALTVAIESSFALNAPYLSLCRCQKTAMRWTYKAEVELLLRAAGFAHWQIRGDFDGRPLEKETDTMIVPAWS